MTIKFIHPGKEVAKDAAKITEINKSYGLVPRENKKDNRSIEQTLNDIRAKKKQKQKLRSRITMRLSCKS